MPSKMTIPGPGSHEETSSSVMRAAQRRVGHDFLFDFMAMIEALRDHDRVVDVHARAFPPVPAFTIETIEHGLGMIIPDRIRSFYQVTDGLEFLWSYEAADGTRQPGGGAHIWGFARVFDAWLDTIWRCPEDEEVDEDFLWTLRGVDATGRTSSEEIVVCCVEETYPSYDLFLHDVTTGRSRLLELSFVEYFEKLLETRGVHGWQSIWAEDAAPGEADRARAMLGEVFGESTL